MFSATEWSVSVLCSIVFGSLRCVSAGGSGLGAVGEDWTEGMGVSALGAIILDNDGGLSLICSFDEKQPMESASITKKVQTTKKNETRPKSKSTVQRTTRIFFAVSHKRKRKVCLVFGKKRNAEQKELSTSF